MQIDVDALERKARGASPGQWRDVVLELIAEVRRLRGIAPVPNAQQRLRSSPALTQKQRTDRVLTTLRSRNTYWQFKSLERLLKIPKPELESTLERLHEQRLVIKGYKRRWKAAGMGSLV